MGAWRALVQVRRHGAGEGTEACHTRRCEAILISIARTVVSSNVTAGRDAASRGPFFGRPATGRLRPPAPERILKPIAEITAGLGLHEDETHVYGRYAAKVDPRVTGRLGKPRGRLVVVTGITPTRFGEGKTTTGIGLAMALERLGQRAIVTLRQGSLGPTFGIKGGALGGGKAKVVPEERIGLHFTGDFHAITAAHNLLAAFVDGHLIHGNALGLDPTAITWPRVLDVNDAALRDIVIGLGGRRCGVPRQSRFDITAASEVMAILGLARDLPELRQRLGAIVVGTTRDHRPVAAEDLRAAGAMAALLRDALMPNLVQTSEGTPALVHTGPFANIAHGNSSIVADDVALRLSDWVVTEAGFGADCGLEKFMHLKVRASGHGPAAAMLVATVRALKHHGGAAGEGEDLEALRRGMENMVRHIEIVRTFGVPVVVAVNRFPDDTDAELEAVVRAANEAGVPAAVSDHFEGGGAGSEAVARLVMAAAGDPVTHALYPLAATVQEKIEAVARAVYGASGVAFEREAAAAADRFTAMGYGALPVCIAKTPLSLSHDPKRIGVPEAFVLPVRDLRLAAGAGYLVALTGDVITMPGLPSRPLGAGVDVAPDGTIRGLR
jgi:formate--tetrahydrofolate ligase